MSAHASFFTPMWLERASGGRWLHAPSAAVRRICHDTRHLQAGDLYVAIRGARLDGHTLVAEAFQKGAVAALVDESFAQQYAAGSTDPLLIVTDVIAALGKLAATHRHRVGAWVTGVTGSVGKTTVKEITASLLGQLGPTVRTSGNWNNHIGLPLSMLAMKQNTRFGVFEVGMNQPGEIHGLSELLTPDWAVITMIGPVHLENFPDVEAIANEKADLLRCLPASGAAFLYGGDPYYALLCDAAPCRVYTLSVEDEEPADFHVIVRDGFVQVYEGGQHLAGKLVSPGPGRHHLINAGLAIMVARIAGCSMAQIGKGFAAYRQPPMRWEVGSCGPFTVVNDAYNANPVSMRAALDTFAVMQAKGRKWLVLGDMLELGEYATEAHKEIGEYIGKHAWAGLVVVGIHARHVCDAAVAAGLPKDRVVAFPSVDEVGAWLLPQLAEEDVLLLKGSRGVQLERLLPVLKEKETT